MAEFLVQVSVEHLNRFIGHRDDNNTAIMIISISAVAFVAALAGIGYAWVTFRTNDDASDAGSSSSSTSEEEADDEVQQLNEIQRENEMVVFRGPAAEEAEECAICLEGYQDGDEVRQMASCGHQFHAACVDRWVSSGSHQQSCPTCRRPVV